MVTVRQGTVATEHLPEMRHILNQFWAAYLNKIDAVLQTEQLLILVNPEEPHSARERNLDLNPCHAEYIKMPRPLLMVSHLDSLIQIVDINSHSEWQTVQIQISWLLKKPTNLDLHYLQRQGIARFSRTRVKDYVY